MGSHPMAPSPVPPVDHHHHPRLPGLRRAYKAILKKCLLNFKSSSKSNPLRPADAAFHPSPPSPQDPLPRDTRRSKSLNGIRSFASFNSDPPSSFRHHHPSFHQGLPLSRNASQRNQPSSVSRSMSHKSVLSTSSPATSDWKSASTPIKFSKSSGTIKPPPIEKKLECSLEELCFGSMKKIIITRDILANNGQTVQEEELLTIKVKPGWRRGTKITFEGMGNERPGSEAADIIFDIAEKKHALFRREGDDLEFAVKVPLVQALTGCTISVPLLGGNKLSLTMNEIIWPGHEQTIVGQGMPTAKDHGIRGNLKITFLVEFPVKLSDKQRSDIVRILQDSS